MHFCNGDPSMFSLTQVAARRHVLFGAVLALPAWALGAQTTPATPAGAAGPPSRPARPIFVLNTLDADVSLIDPGTFATIRRIPTGKEPHHLYLAPDEKSVIVANALGNASLQDSDEITAIDLAGQSRLWTVKVGKMPADIFLAPDDRTLFVALTGDRVVEAWDVAASPPKLVKRIPTGDGGHAFRARGDRRHVFVSNRVANTISLIDMQALAVVAEYPAPGGPDCMELLADGRTLLVSSRWARKPSFIDTEARKVVRQVEVGRSPHGVCTLDHAPRS
jgi:DNA-binding beta-propeller fold protein YncE